jgi:hypothetical protein
MHVSSKLLLLNWTCLVFSFAGFYLFFSMHCWFDMLFEALFNFFSCCITSIHPWSLICEIYEIQTCYYMRNRVPAIPVAIICYVCVKGNFMHHSNSFPLCLGKKKFMSPSPEETESFIEIEKILN